MKIRPGTPPLAFSAPGFIAPMKALGAQEPPAGVWHCEIKFDGYRAIAVINGSQAELWSRNRQPMTGDYPELISALGALPCRSAVLDGEIVALDAAGRSRFQLLQNRGAAGKRPPILYYIFDILHRDGRSLVAQPWEERRRELESLLKRARRPLALSPSFDVPPAELLEAAKRQGLEGVIAKRPASLYESDRRSGAWLKCKVIADQEFVIGGFTAPRRSRAYFGAILVGYRKNGRLLYAGKVGTGFSRSLLESLHAQFLRCRQAQSPFANLPLACKPRFGQGMTRAAMKEVTWLKPRFVAQIKFAEWTAEGLLRQPVFLGLRADKSAKDVRREVGPV
jgi:bifunctional non-homologous end joining protein LigD